MTDQGPSVGGESPAVWARLDEPAATPHRQSSTTVEESAPVRLSRSRSSVLAALDEGGSFLQRNGRQVLVGSSLLLLPVVALNLWTTTLAFNRGDVSNLSAFGGDGVGTGIEDIAALLAVLCSSLAAALIGYYVSSLYIGETFRGRADAKSSFRELGRRSTRIVTAWAIGHFWLPFFAMWTLSSRSGQISGRLTLTLPLAALFATFTLMTMPIMAAEDATAIGALKRSWKLARLRFGSSFGFVVSSAFVGAMLLAGLAWLPDLAEQTGFITFGGYAWLAQGITAQLGIIIVVPLVALATTRFYVEMRMDAEGMDLVLHANAAFGQSKTGHRSL